VPEQDHYLDYVVDFVARHSLRAVDGGWQWKFDRQIFAQFGGGIRGVALPYLSQVRCRLALLRSEYGLVTADIGRSMYDELGRVTPVIELPEAAITRCSTNRSSSSPLCVRSWRTGTTPNPVHANHLAVVAPLAGHP